MGAVHSLSIWLCPWCCTKCTTYFSPNLFSPSYYSISVISNCWLPVFIASCASLEILRTISSENEFLLALCMTSRRAVPMCDKLFTLICYCTERTDLLDQVCSTFQFGVTWVTWNDLVLFFSPWAIIAQSCLQGWVSKKCQHDIENSRHAIMKSVPCCDLPGDPVFLAL